LPKEFLNIKQPNKQKKQRENQKTYLLLHTWLRTTVHTQEKSSWCIDTKTNLRNKFFIFLLLLYVTNKTIKRIVIWLRFDSCLDSVRTVFISVG